MSLGAVDNQFSLDVQGMERLKLSARNNSEEALKEASKQFEALFFESMLKSMRAAIPKSDLLGGSQTDFYESLMDKQWSQELAGRGVGLADQLIASLSSQKQLAAKINGTSSLLDLPRVAPKNLQGFETPVNSAPTVDARSKNDLASQHSTLQPLGETSHKSDVLLPVASPVVGVEDFINSSEFFSRLEVPANEASRTTGVPAELILAQAALETGWGQHQITTAEGDNSFNLFGIKAGDNWQGRTTSVTTHEYVNGVRTAVIDKFRVYDSYEQSFTDYATLLGNNARYKDVLTAGNAEQAAWALQEAGYATDPRYAEKLIAVINQGRGGLTSG
ncbi:MAG: flagellar assembly peptidoglycan hydrolase FlgJ [Porticoccus sp.]